DALLHALFRDHGVHGEVLADVTQESEHVHRRGPVQVVGNDGGILTAIEVEEARHLRLDLACPLADYIERIQFALFGLEAGVTDHAGGATSKSNRTMAGQLHTTQSEERHQGTDVQT